MNFEIIDADGHVTETWEQIARHLDEPYRNFPHWDHSYPKSVKELADRADLTDGAKRQVLAANARKFYKL